MIVAMHQIEELGERIVQKFRPQQVILFGSYAYGQPTEDSDVDLLVIMPYEGHSARKALEIVQSIRPTFAIDVLVRSPEQVQQRLSWNDWFLREVTEKGKVLCQTPLT